MWVRDGRDEDLPRIQSIYNHYIEHSHATFDLEKRSLEDRQEWFGGFAETGPHRLFVVEVSDRVEAVLRLSRDDQVQVVDAARELADPIDVTVDSGVVDDVHGVSRAVRVAAQ